MSLIRIRPRNLAVGLALFMVAAIALLFWRSGRPLARRLEQIRAQGDPLTVADLRRQSETYPAAGAETARLLEQAGQIAEQIGLQQRSLYDRMFEADFTWTDEDSSQIAQSDDLYAQLLPKVHAVASLRDYRPITRIDDSPQNTLYWDKSRSIFRALYARALYELEQGRPDEAFEIGRSMLAISEHLEHEPYLIGHLLALACRGIAIQTLNEVIQQHAISPDQRAKLDEQLARLDNWDGFRRAMAQERVVVLTSIDQLRWPGLFKPQSKMTALDLIDQALATAERPVSSVPATNAQPPSRLSMIVNGPAQLLVGPYETCHVANARSLAQVRCLRILNKLQQAEAQSEQEASLDALGLPAEALVDPYNGQALNVRRDERGWTVYSVGANFKDDGGQILGHPHLDEGIGPSQEPPAK